MRLLTLKVSETQRTDHSLCLYGVLVFFCNSQIESKTRMQMGVDSFANLAEQDHDADGMTELSLGAIVVPLDEVNKAEALRIEVIEGPEANRGTVLDINAQGLVGSQRSKNDGCTILGSLKQSAKGDVYNDFVI